MRTGSTSQFELNRAVYHAPGVSRIYPLDSLERVEAAALIQYQPSFAGRNVLDLGVGTGRTIDFLKPIARHYVSMDYSPVMVDFVRSMRPDVEIHLADMRNLSPWGAEAFDFVFGSNNVLDAVSHDDRLKTLSEIRRVLSSNGVFMFSSHNRRYRYAGSAPRLQYSRNPVTQLLNARHYLRQKINHRRLSRLRRFEQDYALLDDIGHDFSVLHYYVDRHVQRRQLEETGFHLLDVFDSSGNALGQSTDDSPSPSLMYVAQVRT